MNTYGTTKHSLYQVPVVVNGKLRKQASPRCQGWAPRIRGPGVRTRAAPEGKICWRICWLLKLVVRLLM